MPLPFKAGLAATLIVRCPAWLNTGVFAVTVKTLSFCAKVCNDSKRTGIWNKPLEIKPFMNIYLEIRQSAVPVRIYNIMPVFRSGLKTAYVGNGILGRRTRSHIPAAGN